MYFQCTILQQVVVLMGAGIGKSVKHRSECPSRLTSAAKLHIPQQLSRAGGPPCTTYARLTADSLEQNLDPALAIQW
jgi:hypothetical protein